MPGPVSRRQLLGMILGKGPRPRETRTERADTAAIAGDFTPGMLAMEAERLGLDPDMDREDMLAAVMIAMGEAMRPSEEENGPMRPEA